MSYFGNCQDTHTNICARNWKVTEKLCKCARECVQLTFTQMHAVNDALRVGARFKKLCFYSPFCVVQWQTIENLSCMYAPKCDFTHIIILTDEFVWNTSDYTIWSNVQLCTITTYRNMVTKFLSGAHASVSISLHNNILLTTFKFL